MTEFPYSSPEIYWIEDPTFKVYSKVLKWANENFEYDTFYHTCDVETLRYHFKHERDLTWFLFNWPNLHYMDESGSKIGNW